MTTHALVLAAGSGTRFGTDKLMAPLHGRPLVAYSLDAVAGAIEAGTLEGGVVVARHDANELARLVAGARMRLVVNPRSQEGLSTSLRAGLEALEPTNASGALVIQADQPMLTAAVIEAVVSAASEGTADLVRPVYEEGPGIPGHPAWIGRRCWPHARALAGDEGFARLVREGALREATIPLSGSNPDVNTVEDLARLAGLFPGPRPESEGR